MDIKDYLLCVRKNIYEENIFMLKARCFSSMIRVGSAAVLE